MRRGMPRLCDPGLTGSVSGTLPVLVSISDSESRRARSRSLRVMLARAEARSDVTDQVGHAGPPGTRFLAAEMLVPYGYWPGPGRRFES